MNSISDYSLVGFWPLDEPSGTPFFHNYAPNRALAPSGVSFELHVAHARDGLNDLVWYSPWLGQDRQFDVVQGNDFVGHVVPGSFDDNGTGDDDGDDHRHLIVGQGGFAARSQFLVPPYTATSGFTVGLWVNPRTNGRANEILSALQSTPKINSIAHALFCKGQADDHWTIGVSGLLDQGAQFAVDPDTDGKQLQAYAHFSLEEQAPGQTNKFIHLQSPIESGKYTHIAFTYQLTRADGGGNTDVETALYIDGIAQASGTLTGIQEVDTFHAQNAVYRDAPLALGAANEEGTTGVDVYLRSTGWAHMVSGAYCFERPLTDGEMRDMHERGGLHPGDGTIRREAKEVLLTDNSIVGYYPFIGDDFLDVSQNHNALGAGRFVGDQFNTAHVDPPGAFNRAIRVNLDSNGAERIVALSGVTESLFLDSDGSFTISCLQVPDNVGLIENNMAFSLGSTDDAPRLVPLIADHTAGFFLSHDINLQNEMGIVIYPGGNPSDSVLLRAVDGDDWATSVRHLAFVHDAQTNGVAFYMNGYLQESGTLSTSFVPHLQRLAGSGFPILFANSVPDSDVKGVTNTGGQDNGLQEIFIASRPLEPQEILGLAVSGIDVTSIYYTPNDPRLMGYWRCTENNGNSLLRPDSAKLFSQYPANLVLSHTDSNWDLLENTDTGSPWLAIDYFGNIPIVNDGNGNSLGVSSGVWTVMGVSKAAHEVTTIQNRNTFINFQDRYKIFGNDIQETRQGFSSEHIITFEVTPSGAIPNTFDAIGEEFNSIVFDYGNLCNLNISGDGRYWGFVTTHNAGVEGTPDLSFVVHAREGPSTQNALVSGAIPFGVPTRVAVHTRPLTKFGEIDTADVDTVLDLYIGGTKVDTFQAQTDTLKIWSAGNPNSAADAWVMSFGGFVGPDLRTTDINAQTGFGEMYMREASVWRGTFTVDDVAHIVSSGVVSSTVPGFTNSNPTTQVTIADSDLVGYYRFNSPVSGELDLSLQGNDLINLGRLANNLPGGPATNARAGHLLKYIPGPLTTADIAVQASGVSYIGQDFTADNQALSPFMSSGTVFQNPQNGFSVGFLFCNRVETAGNDAGFLLSFGKSPGINTSVDTTVDASWAIVADDGGNIKMILSHDGHQFYDNSAGAAGNAFQITCGTFHNSDGDRPYDNNDYEEHRNGNVAAPHEDAWSHYLWTYDPAGSGTVRCYFNGELVDRKSMSGRQLNIPADDASKFLNFFFPQTDTWEWGGPAGDVFNRQAVITELCYFTDVVTPEEARYIALNGIDLAVGTPTSGIIGGYVQGLDTGSGHIAGYVQGLDTGSGMIGGIVDGSIAVSGLIGGYVSGVVFATGSIGAYVQGLETGSGLIGGFIPGAVVGSGHIGGLMRGGDVGSGHIGGYIAGSTPGSGILGGFILGSTQGSGTIGGWILGGLQGNLQFDTSYTVQAIAAQDFDALLEARQENTSDFDAKLVVFQSEIPPEVGIIIPGQTVTGLSPPFNQYFIGKASGLQGKTITSTRWTFGDLSPTVSVAESGAGCYPVQHRYATSGIFIAKFEAIDSHGIHNSATRIINVASGIPEVIVTLSGVPRSGNAELIVDFDTNVDSLPVGVSISTQLLLFDDGQTTTSFDPTHAYTQPGIYKPVWCVRDSRGFLWCDSLESGHDQ